MLYKKNHYRKRQRRGAIAVFAALMVVVFIGMVAFAVDYGYLLKVRTDLQRAADAAALAAVQDLIPAANGIQDLDRVRATARTYAQANLGNGSFQVATTDIEIGRFDPQTIYSNVTLLNTGTFDTVRVTLRRNGSTNPLVPLFFARALGHNSSAVAASAAAALQKAEVMLPGADVLPFSTPQDLWNNLNPGDTWNAYGDGKLEDGFGNPVPGNWGTLDIGSTNNSTSDLVNQIINGLRQVDLDALYADDRIASDEFLDGSATIWMNGDPGLSTGIKHGVQAVHGQKRLVPIYDQLGGSPQGANVEFRVVRWGVVTVIDSVWRGSKNTAVTLMKSHTYSGELRPKGSLAGQIEYIEAAYTSPVLVE